MSLKVAFFFHEFVHEKSTTVALGGCSKTPVAAPGTWWKCASLNPQLWVLTHWVGCQGSGHHLLLTRVRELTTGFVRLVRAGLCTCTRADLVLKGHAFYFAGLSRETDAQSSPHHRCDWGWLVSLWLRSVLKRAHLAGPQKNEGFCPVSTGKERREKSRGAGASAGLALASHSINAEAKA